MPMKYTVFFDKEKCRGYVASNEQANDLEKRWYGRREAGKLSLDIVELAYLLLRKQLVIMDLKKIEDLNSFLNNYYFCLEEFFWPRLIVYKDLRDRGRRVKVLDQDKFIVKDKYGDLRLVVVLEEGSMRRITSISEHIDKAMDNNLKLVYAIVSLQGDLTYYEVTKIKPKRD
ncbi:MAG: endonuclease [Desulfurococcales archaeon ex4484_58]|nr:MAG: endonuclease [Desulfurococcales archaeon ex4484_58]